MLAHTARALEASARERHLVEVGFLRQTSYFLSFLDILRQKATYLRLAPKKSMCKDCKNPQNVTASAQHSTTFTPSKLRECPIHGMQNVSHFFLNISAFASPKFRDMFGTLRCISPWQSSVFSNYSRKTKALEKILSQMANASVNTKEF